MDEGGFNFFSMQVPRTRDATRFVAWMRARTRWRLESSETPKMHKVNAIFVADIDMISDFFFQERNLGNLSIEVRQRHLRAQCRRLPWRATNPSSNFAVDVPQHRTLVRVEQQKRGFLQAANKAEREADKAADEELKQRREQLSKRVKEIQENEDLDPIAKAQMLKQAQEAEQQANVAGRGPDRADEK